MAEFSHLPPEAQARIAAAQEQAKIRAAETRARVEVDVAAATQESFETNSSHVKTLDDGSEHLSLFIQPRPLVIARVDVDRSPVDNQGNRVTIMKLAPIAKIPRSRLQSGPRIGNGEVHSNVWRLTEPKNGQPKFEAGQLDANGSFTPFDDELMACDETVASFGSYWPANLRQGSPENPLRRSRGVGGILGRVVLRQALPPLQHKNYYD